MLRSVCWPLPTFRDNISDPYSRGKQSRNMNCLTLKDGTERLSRNVGNCQYTLRNITEEGRCHSATEAWNHACLMCINIQFLPSRKMVALTLHMWVFELGLYTGRIWPIILRTTWKPLRHVLNFKAEGTHIYRFRLEGESTCLMSMTIINYLPRVISLVNYVTLPFNVSESNDRLMADCSTALCSK
jgi:hypothetical protein